MLLLLLVETTHIITAAPIRAANVAMKPASRIAGAAAALLAAPVAMGDPVAVLLELVPEELPATVALPAWYGTVVIVADDQEDVDEAPAAVGVVLAPAAAAASVTRPVVTSVGVATAATPPYGAQRD